MRFQVSHDRLRVWYECKHSDEPDFILHEETFMKPEDDESRGHRDMSKMTWERTVQGGLSAVKTMLGTNEKKIKDNERCHISNCDVCGRAKSITVLELREIILNAQQVDYLGIALYCRSDNIEIEHVILGSGVGLLARGYEKTEHLLTMFRNLRYCRKITIQAQRFADRQEYMLIIQAALASSHSITSIVIECDVGDMLSSGRDDDDSDNDSYYDYVSYNWPEWPEWQSSFIEALRLCSTSCPLVQLRVHKLDFGEHVATIPEALESHNSDMRFLERLEFPGCNLTGRDIVAVVQALHRRHYPIRYFDFSRSGYEMDHEWFIAIANEVGKFDRLETFLMEGRKAKFSQEFIENCGVTDKKALKEKDIMLRAEIKKCFLEATKNCLSLKRVRLHPQHADENREYELMLNRMGRFNWRVEGILPHNRDGWAHMLLKPSLWIEHHRLYIEKHPETTYHTRMTYIQQFGRSHNDEDLPPPSSMMPLYFYEECEFNILYEMIRTQPSLTADLLLEQTNAHIEFDDEQPRRDEGSDHRGIGTQKRTKLNK